MSDIDHGILNADDSSEWAEWDAFVHRSPLGTAYHTSAWLLPLIQEMGQDIQVHVVAESGDIRAGAVVRRARRFGMVVGRKPWATAYSGPVSDTADVHTFFGALLRRIRRSYHHVRLVTTPDADSSSVFSKPWSVKVDTTAILDLRDVESLWNRFDRHVRQRVRKAEDAGVRVSEAEEAESFYHLYRLTYDRQGIPMTLASGEVTRVLESAKARGVARLFLAQTRTNEPAAALVVLADTKRAYLALAGSHPAHRKTDAVTLLWWHVIQQYATSHCELDLVGMGIPAIARFKRSFCPAPQSFLDASSYSSIIAKVAIGFADTFRKVKGRNKLR